MDDDLNAIRARRLAELEKNYASTQGASGMAMPKPSSSGNDEEQQRQREEMRNNMLLRILEPAARERLHTLGLVRKDRQRQVEDYLLQMAQSGRLPQRVDEPELIRLLTHVSEQAPGLRVTRKSHRLSEDEDD